MIETKKDLVVVKVGTNVLTRQDSFDWPMLDEYAFRNIGEQINELTDEGTGVVLVTSAAIIAGHQYTHEERTYEKSRTIDKQRMACLGQATLMFAWQNALKPYRAGQLVFTRSEIEDGEGEELVTVTNSLIDEGYIPVANENDALSHEEITFGDNDTLAARFAVLLKRADIFKSTRLVLLSDVHGVYEDMADEGSVIPMIDDVEAYKNFLDDQSSKLGTGGMAGKFAAAKIASNAGIEMRLGHGRAPNAIKKILSDQVGTRFLSQAAELG